MRPARFASQLNEFLGSKEIFRVLHQSQEPRGPIYVLDSSFNPPHYGHLELVSLSAGSGTHVILLLSVNNADKKPVPASFIERLDMIYLFGENLVTKNWNYSICISKSPKFVDKSAEIDKYFLGNKTYLMGYDTLIRVLNPKYYVPLLIQEALDHFMTSNKFICLTRDKEVGDQLKYLETLKDGESDLPSHWGSQIDLLVNNRETSTISSSEIRKLLANDKPVTGLTTTEIIQYIKENDPYGL